MSLKLRPNKLSRFLYITCRRYCDKKSIYQRDEEGPKPRLVYGEEYPEWRKQWIKRDGEWYSKLSVFNRKNPSPGILNSMQQLPNLSLQHVKNWWADMKVIQEVENQRYIAQRVATLGSNLAAMHFFAFRGAKVRLKDSQTWMTFEDKDNLPPNFEEGYFVEAVDCEKFHHNGIRYEGIQNLTNLNFLKWLSFKNNRHVDVWCLDRVAGQNGHSLEYLNVTGCNLCFGCIQAISRMTALKMLVLNDPKDDLSLQAALSILEQQNPNIFIKISDEYLLEM